MKKLQSMRLKVCACVSILLWLIIPNSLIAQDPKLPATNLGLVNMQDGNPPGTGMVFQQINQVYLAGRTYGDQGQIIDSNQKITTLLSMQQFIHITNIRFLSGNLGYTVLLPLVKITNVSQDGTNSLTSNPSPIGDLTIGTLVQWFDKHIGNMKLAHRIEFDATLPVGAYNSNYLINTSSHFYTFSLHHAFTIFPTDNFSISMRNHIHYNTKEIDSHAKAGMFYHNNYSLEYSLNKAFRIEATGYYLQQLQQDSYNGNKNYYKENYGIADTKERVFAYGVGVGYLTPSGTFLELKGVKETGVQNRTGGFRATLLVNFKID
jgi:hypothetical protein